MSSRQQSLAPSRKSSLPLKDTPSCHSEERSDEESAFSLEILMKSRSPASLGMTVNRILQQTAKATLSARSFRPCEWVAFRALAVLASRIGDRLPQIL